MASGHTKVSQSVKEILDDLLKRQGDSVITADEAANLYGGHYPTTLMKLGTVELLQVALLEAYVMLAEANSKRRHWWQRKPRR